jgi:hypothetical protein
MKFWAELLTCAIVAAIVYIILELTMLPRNVIPQKKTSAPHAAQAVAAGVAAATAKGAK